MKKTDAEIKALEVGLGFFEELKVVASPPHIVDSGASVMPRTDNEPVAYFVKDKQGWWAETDKETGIPLYSHPVKELTIEEIDEVSKEIFKGYKNFYHYQINFARAILRKAQET